MRVLRITLAALVIVALMCVVGEVSRDNRMPLPLYRETTVNHMSAQQLEKMFTFDDGGVFSISRFVFGQGNTDSFTHRLDLSGHTINIRWQEYAEVNTWRSTTDINQLPKATLFIETDTESAIVSIPALYYNNFEHSTIEALPDCEQAIRIERTDGGYALHLTFTPQPDTVGECWYYKTPRQLTDWNEQNSALLLRQDLHQNRRFCFDGYYFRTYTNYIPYKPNGFFRNPANFTGAHLLTFDGALASVGYAMTNIAQQNQNEYGFWSTGPMSLWLNTDYGIGYGFYDTRFSTDFARSLLDAHALYADDNMLAAAERYAAWLMRFGDSDGYSVGARGVLIPDYWGAEQTLKTHVSLNHHVSEMNFLLELHDVSGDSTYFDYAMRMLDGVAATEDDWLLPDGNLKYALMYDTSSNNMQDYPFLTYNDLFDAARLLRDADIECPAIERLMTAKKQWMDANGVVGYKE